MTGAGEIKVDEGETGGNHQKGLNGGQVSTEKRIGRVVNCRETSNGRRRSAGFVVYTKAPSETEEETARSVSVRRAGQVGAPAKVSERERLRWRKKIKNRDRHYIWIYWHVSSEPHWTSGP
jgi:hypothetical protein